MDRQEGMGRGRKEERDARGGGEEVKNKRREEGMRDKTGRHRKEGVGEKEGCREERQEINERRKR